MLGRDLFGSLFVTFACAFGASAMCLHLRRRLLLCGGKQVFDSLRAIFVALHDYLQFTYDMHTHVL